MAKKLSKTQSTAFKTQMLAEFDDYLTELIDSENDTKQAKADKIAYWMKDWIKYLKAEETFYPERLRKYKRGNIVKVHLGFNVGSEEGGLHYAIVVDSNNSLKNPLMTVIPLTSLKNDEKLDKLPRDQIYLGTEIHDLLSEKLTSLLNELSQFDLAAATAEELEQFEADLEYARRIKKEISRMKTGSIALLGQLTTISKLRIFDPKNKYGVLKGLKISDNTLDSIDEKLKKLFLKKCKNS